MTGNNAYYLQETEYALWKQINEQLIELADTRTDILLKGKLNAGPYLVQL